MQPNLYEGLGDGNGAARGLLIGPRSEKTAAN